MCVLLQEVFIYFYRALTTILLRRPVVTHNTKKADGQQFYQRRRIVYEIISEMIFYLNVLK
jgi:hypothetical protein